MLVSIVIPTYNRIEVLKSLILSIQNQTHTQFECVIQDNGPSSDGTHEFIRTLGLSDKRFTISSSGPIGYTRAINRGLAAAVGDLYLIMDDDVELIEPSTLSFIVEKFKAETKLGAMQISEFYPNGKGKFKTTPPTANTTKKPSYNDLWSNTANAEPGAISKWGIIGTKLHNLSYGSDHQVCHLRSSCLSVRSEIFKRLDGFCEDYVFFGRGYRGDTDFSFGVNYIGYDVVYCCSGPQILHKLSPKTRGWQRGGIASAKYLLATHRNNMYFFLRNFWHYKNCLVYVLWDICVGSSQQPGLVRLVRWGPRSITTFCFSILGKLLGVFLFLRRGPRPWPER